MSRPRPSPGSIRRRLTLQLLTGAAVMAVVLFLIVYNFAREIGAESQDTILAASATAILDATTVQSGEVRIDIPYSAFTMLDNTADDRVFYRITQDGAGLTGYDDLPAARLDPGASAGFDTVTYRGAALRLATLSRLVSIDGTPARIDVSVGQTRDAQAEMLARILRMTVLLGLGFFAASAGLAVLAGQSTAASLRRLAASVSRRGPADLRPVVAEVPREMRPLVKSLNSLISRLSGALNRTEDFIAEAAHRVRTPLATVRAHADNTLRRVDKEENRAALREMIRAIDESSRAAGQLLDHAMVSLRADQLELTSVALRPLVGELVDRLRPLADLKDMDLHFDDPQDAEIMGDAILIQNAVRNLIDNAIKYAPPETPVEVALTANGGQATLTIRDRGRGFPITGTEGLTGRFARGENAADVVGSGLGLTIAEEVARAHRGTLTIANIDGGPGACVSLSFPLH
ncbi:sensor histidine kinase [Rhodobacteraceae bacterium W635]|uniref:sensor histidine kinase n=1 Tax=Nioella halotolerans TaxID=2303578 RepID=UPI000E3E0386|nr:sensor histidine kinase [Rhodobacteraceae bacterium W635]